MTTSKQTFLKNLLQRLYNKYRFSLENIIISNNIKTNIVLHVGANFGQEADTYDHLNFKNIFWVEGFPEYIEKLKMHVGTRDNHSIFEAMISDIDNELVNFTLTSNHGSSSIYEFTDSWKSTFKDIQPLHSEKIKCRRLDSLFDESDELLKINSINLMVLDIEGAELKALKSLGNYINNIEYALIEISFRNNFKGGPLISDIDEFMMKNNFIRKYTKISAASGDALYKKVARISILKKLSMFFSAKFFQIVAYLHITDLIVYFRGIVKNGV